MIRKSHRQQTDTTTIDIDGIKVWMKDQYIYLYHDDDLAHFLRTDKVRRTYRLSTNIKHAYRSHFSEDLAISIKSLTAEILGHYWVDKWAIKISSALPVFPFQQLCNFVHSRTRQIDCGAAHIDSNRWIWDILGKWCMPVI